MSTFRRKLWKWIAGTFAVLVILLGLGVGAFRIVLDQVPEYRAQIQDWISERSGLHIAFSGIDARWRAYGPELVFENAVVSTPQGDRILVQARRGSVALDIWASLATGRITTGRFWLDAPQLLLVRTVDGHIELVGQDELPERTRPFSFDALPTGLFSVSDARVTFRDLATGRGPWEFARVGLTLLRSADSMRLNGTAELPSALGKQLEFAAQSAGQLDDPEALRWNFELAGADLALAGLADLLPQEWPAPTTGTASFKLAGVFSGKRVEALNGGLDATGVNLPLPVWSIPLPGADPLVVRESADEAGNSEFSAAAPGVETAETSDAQRIVYDLVRTTFDMRRKPEGGWHLVLDGLQLVRPGTRWDPSRVELEVDAAATDRLSLRGTAEFLSLDSVWPLLAYLPQQDNTARLRALHAEGRLNDLGFRFERTAADVPPSYSFTAKFAGVSFAPVGRSPGLAGLTGEVVATDQNGRLQLAARDLRFTLPHLFREPLATDRVEAAVTWTRETDRWLLAGDNVVLDDADGKAAASFKLAIPDDRSSPILDLQATGTDLDASATPRYLPAGRLTAKSVAWLGRAFPAGKVTTASIQYNGPMRAFPFRAGEGTFLARGELAGITLDYDARWYPVTDISGDVEFNNAGFTGHATRGLVHGLEMDEGRVRVADLKTMDLDIEAKGKGDLGAALEYLQRSPVAPGLGERFIALEGRGATTFDARLRLPLKEMERRKIDVTSHLVNAELGQRDLPQKLTALNGSVQVLDRALVSPGLQGQFLGGPVNIVMAAQQDGLGAPASTVLNVSGRALAAPLKELLNIPDAAALSGSAAWRLQGDIVLAARADAANRASSVVQSYVIDSDLTGLGIGLPAPLQKGEAERRSLHAEIEFDGGSDLLMRGSLGDLRTVAVMNRKNGAWVLDRAGVRADGVAASVPGHAGVRIEGELPNFVLDDWLALKGSGADQASKWRLNDYLKAANVRVDTFGFLGYSWSDVRGLLQATDAGWQVDVAGPDATGQVIVPYDLTATAPLTFEMERLVVGSRTAGTRASSADPRQVPAIQAHVDDFEWGGRKLGDVRAQLDRAPQGLAVTNLTAQSGSFSAEITGSWLSYDVAGTGPRSISTTIDATLASTDVQSALQALGYGDVVTANRGLLQAKLSWPGSPDTQALGRASGTVHLELDDGQMLDLQPGAGRVLGLLSVAALPRRLSLDFSDLTDKGLAFDSVRGDFELKQGDAYTSNLLLAGPAAEIGIAGRVGLATRDYDQTAVVTGNIGATLPVAGALAGGPVVGAAMLLFSQVFKEPLKGITRGYYRITGKWDEPQIERVLASDAKEAAARTPSASPARPSPGSSTSP